jgi:predicted nucleic acid-binding protein
MVVIDATMLMLLFRPNVPARVVDSTGKPIEHVHERINYLVKTLEGIKSRIVIPTPVLSEILVRATAEETQRILEEINRVEVFRVEPFETRAAIEVAVMTRTALAGGNKRGISEAPWAKVKFDRQIVAIARVMQASAIYTDDEDLAGTAEVVHIPTFGIADLALPPETAQKAFAFESKEADAIDEITEQVTSLKEPEIPDGPPDPEQGGG